MIYVFLHELGLRTTPLVRRRLQEEISLGVSLKRCGKFARLIPDAFLFLLLYPLIYSKPISELLLLFSPKEKALRIDPK